MAGKRSATSDLNHDNWDREEAPEDSGNFQRASDDSLKRRVIKTARRRNPISSVRDGSDGENKSAFTSFTGFSKTPPPTTAAFSFLSNLPPKSTKVNGVEGKSEKEKSDMSSFKFNSNPPETKSVDTPNKSNVSKLAWTPQTENIPKNLPKNMFATNTTSNNKDNSSNSPPNKSNDYYSKLKGLNQSVSNWIKKHVDSNPFINLKPIFQDYEKYFSELEKEKDVKLPDTNSKTEVSSMGSFAFKPTTVPDSTTEKTASDKDSSEKDKDTPKFTFGTSSGPSTGTPSFSFGNKSSTGESKSFSFGTATKDVTKTTTTTPSFTFGVNPPAAAVTVSEQTKSVNTTSPSFTFGSKPSSGLETTKNVSTPFSFGAKPSSSVSETESTSSKVSHVSFGSLANSTESSKTTSTFTFGAKSSSSSIFDTAKDDATSTNTTKPSFGFGSLPSNSTIPPFSSSSPFTFSNVVKPVSSDEKIKSTEEEEEESPKNEFTPVIEEDHIYTIRCKVFVKKNGKFGDRGVGNLFLKPVADSEKVQLVVRADTNLGNLLINLILSKSIPTKRLGTKDVMLVCVPSPDVEPPPVPVLFRVKSSEEADQLLETLEKYKK